jgi:hypothetical protein
VLYLILIGPSREESTASCLMNISQCTVGPPFRFAFLTSPGLSHRTSFGKITSEGRHPGASGRTSESADRRRTAQADGRLADGPSGRPPGGRPKRTAPWRTAQVDGRLADGPGGRPVLRQSAQPPYRKTARNIITFFNFFSPLQGSPSSTVAPRVTPQSYFLL